jgi:hypothetical protein
MEAPMLLLRVVGCLGVVLLLEQWLRCSCQRVLLVVALRLV